MRDQDKEIIKKAKSFLIEGELSAVAGLLSNALDSPPKIILNPNPSTITVPELLPVFNHWSALKNETGFVRAQDLVLLDLVEAVRFLMLLDVEDGGWQFRYRYYGEGIAERSGFDLTGSSTSDIPVTPQISMFFIACYQRVIETREPLYSWHAAPPAITVACWDRLLLPLMNDDGTEVIRILGVNIPGPWRRAAPDA